MYCPHFRHTLGSDAKMQKLRLLWMQVLAVAEAALRTPVTKEPCLLSLLTWCI